MSWLPRNGEEERKTAYQARFAVIAAIGVLAVASVCAYLLISATHPVRVVTKTVKVADLDASLGSPQQANLDCSQVNQQLAGHVCDIYQKGQRIIIVVR